MKEVSKYSSTRQKCEFCGDTHYQNKELCCISVKGHPNGNDFE